MSKIFVPNLVMFAQIQLEKFKGTAKNARKMQFKVSEAWKHDFRVSFPHKTQYVGKNMFKWICAKSFLGLFFLFLSRFYFAESPSGMELIKIGKQLKTCVYRKTTNKGLLLHYQSHVDAVINDPF